jgi:hypothetical protein
MSIVRPARRPGAGPSDTGSQDLTHFPGRDAGAGWSASAGPDGRPDHSASGLVLGSGTRQYISVPRPSAGPTFSDPPSCSARSARLRRPLRGEPSRIPVPLSRTCRTRSVPGRLDDPLSSGEVRALRSGRVCSERRAGRTRSARQLRARQPGLVPGPSQATQRSASCSSSTQRLRLSVYPIGYSLSQLQPSAGRRCGSQSGSQHVQTPGHVERLLPGIVPSDCHAGRHQATSGDRAELIWEQEAVGSNPAIPTKHAGHRA